MRVLVTGVAGLIGSWITEALCAEKDIEKVVGVDDLSGGVMENVDIIRSHKFAFEQVDITQYRKIEEVFAQNRPDVVVHAAACAREGASAFQPHKITLTNSFASSIITELGIKYGMKKLIFFSSMAVSGDNKVPFTEDMPRKPVDVYGTSKSATEQCIEQLSKVHDFQYTIIRPHNCFTEDTEILTRDRGFIYFSELSFSDHVATLNPKTGYLEWQEPSEIQRFPYRGDMYRFHPRGVDLLVTPDHHLWLRRKNKDFDFIRADSITEDDYWSEFMGGASWEGKDQDYKILPECPDSKGHHDPRNPQRAIAMDSWLTLMGWFISEGSVFATPSNYVVDITNYNQKNREEIKKTIIECGYHPYDHDPRDIRIHSKQLYMELIHMAGSLNKHIPQELKDLPVERLKVLFTALLKGDGSFAANGSPRHYKTISKRLAGDVEEVATKLGYRVNHSIYQEKTIPNAQPCFVLTFASEWTTPRLGSQKLNRIAMDRVPYEGMVYDCTVPNHVILVRRNGKVIWSGNCFGERVSLTDPYRNVIAIFANRLMRREPIYIFGDGHIRAFSYLADSIPAFVKTVTTDKANGQIVFVGGKEQITIEQLADAVIEDFNPSFKAEIIHLEPRPLEVKEAFCSIEKSVKLLGYKETIGWREGVRRTVAWAKSKGPQRWKVDVLPLRSDKMPLPWRELEKQ